MSKLFPYLSSFLASSNSSLNILHNFEQAIFSKVLLLSRLRNFVIIRAPWLKKRLLGAEEAGIPRYFRAKIANIGNLALLDFQYSKGFFDY